MRTSVAAIAGLALCLPCLLVLGVFGAAFVGFAAIGAWFSDNALVLGAATAAALMVGTLGRILYMRRVGGAACEVDPAKETLAWSRREPTASAPESSAVAGGDKR